VEQIAEGQQQSIFLRGGERTIWMTAQVVLVILKNKASKWLTEVESLKDRVQITGIVDLLSIRGR
jgi:hypothetical protein